MYSHPLPRKWKDKSEFKEDQLQNICAKHSYQEGPDFVILSILIYSMGYLEVFILLRQPLYIYSTHHSLQAFQPNIVQWWLLS